MSRPTPLHCIRTLDVGRFRVTVDALPEDQTPQQTLRGTAHEGDEEILRKCADARLVHFAVRVAVTFFPDGPDGEPAYRTHQGGIELATTWLGGCIYPSYEAVAGPDGYVPDLITEAVHKARRVFAEAEVRAAFDSGAGTPTTKTYTPRPLDCAIEKARDLIRYADTLQVAVHDGSGGAGTNGRRLWAPRTPRPGAIIHQGIPA